MIIPINLSDSGTSTSTAHSLPSQFAQFGTDEVVLIELQGALDVEGNKEGQVVGKLSIDDNTVRKVNVSSLKTIELNSFDLVLI